MKKNTIADIVTIVFMGLFFYTATQKLLVVGTVSFILKRYPFLNLAPSFFAWVIPILELSLVATLFFRRTIGLWTSLITMLFFTLYVTYMLIFLPQLPCTCGGFIQHLSWPLHLALNAFLTVIAFVGIKADVSAKHRPAIFSNTLTHTSPI